MKILPLSKQTEVAKSTSDNKNKNCAQNFGSMDGFLNAATKGLGLCNKYPMLNVTLADGATSIVPHTLMDLKTGIPAASETLRRESSGLLVNCLLPSFIVLGVSKILNKPVMDKEFSKINMSSSWANSETIDKLAEIFKNVADKNSAKTTKNEVAKFVKSTLENIEALDGSEWISYADKLKGKNGPEALNILTNAIYDMSADKKTVKSAVSKAAELIGGEAHATETLRFIGSDKLFGSNLAELLRDQVDVGKKFMNKEVRENLDGFSKAAKKLVNSKSILGMAIILPLAMSMQAINRAITKKKYNIEGAPIYKDAKNDNPYKKMSPAQKTKFFGQKLVAAGSMVSLALLSMMKKPTLSMFQFKGMFPTVDQCRWIATATFVSRIFASEDPNELRESSVRDMASFASLYFLGDYAAKAAATIIEKKKPDIKLLNRMAKSKPSDSLYKKAGDWIRRTSLKSFDEVLPNAKNMRSVCQLASLGFSIISLGLILPAYNRHVTEKKVKEQKELELQNAYKINDTQTKLVVDLRTDKSLSGSGVFGIVAQDCFK